MEHVRFTKEAFAAYKYLLKRFPKKYRGVFLEDNNVFKFILYDGSWSSGEESPMCYIVLSRNKKNPE